MRRRTKVEKRGLVSDDDDEHLFIFGIFRVSNRRKQMPGTGPMRLKERGPFSSDLTSSFVLVQHQMLVLLSFVKQPSSLINFRALAETSTVTMRSETSPEWLYLHPRSAMSHCDSECLATHRDLDFRITDDGRL